MKKENDQEEVNQNDQKDGMKNPFNWIEKLI